MLIWQTILKGFFEVPYFLLEYCTNQVEMLEEKLNNVAKDFYHCTHYSIFYFQWAEVTSDIWLAFVFTHSSIQ